MVSMSSGPRPDPDREGSWSPAPSASIPEFFIFDEAIWGKMHGRAAGQIVTAVRGLNADVTIGLVGEGEPKEADAHSVLSILQNLGGAHNGRCLVVYASGPDAQIAMDKLSKLDQVWKPRV